MVNCYGKALRGALAAAALAAATLAPSSARAFDAKVGTPPVAATTLTERLKVCKLTRSVRGRATCAAGILVAAGIVAAKDAGVSVLREILIRLGADALADELFPQLPRANSNKQENGREPAKEPSLEESKPTS